MAELRFDGEVGEARKYVYTAADGSTHRFVISHAQIAAQGGQVDIPLSRAVDRIEAGLRPKTGWVV